MADACGDAGATYHVGGTYVCMEGPQFSTRAESELYRSWGVDVIGMTNLQEAKLAREAEICYSTLAMVTDYDCWHPDHDAVTAEQIIGNLGRNAEMAKAVLRAAVRRMPVPAGLRVRDAPCKYALVTAPEHVPADVKRDLAPIIGRYMRVAGRRPDMSILVVGSVAYDTVETPFGRAERVLGGSASFFSVAASFFAPVNLVGVVGSDFGEEQIAAFRGPTDRPRGPRADGRARPSTGRGSTPTTSTRATRSAPTSTSSSSSSRRSRPATAAPRSSSSGTSTRCCSSTCSSRSRSRASWPATR